ncbi:MAG: ankyrin repeat domain-containing protein [Opitutaceae bacterium]|nr:ankyrin repeat domain-containing protein [Opitutaceae bacterium]
MFLPRITHHPDTRPDTGVSRARDVALRIFRAVVVTGSCLFAALSASPSPLTPVVEPTKNMDANGMKPTASVGDFVRLVDAVRLGDVAGVRRLLESGIDINRTDALGQTALFHALHAGQMGAARVLVEAGTDVEKDIRGEPPLGWAAAFGEPDVVRLIAGRSAGVSHGGADTRALRALVMAARWGRVDNFRELEKTGVVWKARSSGKGNTGIGKGKDAVVDGGGAEKSGGAGGAGGSMLVSAAGGGNVDMIGYILAQGVLFDTVSGTAGVTPLNAAVQSGNREAVRALLDAGADPNKTGVVETPSWNRGTRTPLALAVILGEHEMAALLLERGADPGAQKNEAILWADFMGDGVMRDMLRRAGAPEPEPFEWMDRFGASRWRVEPGRRLRESSEARALASLVSLLPAANGTGVADVGAATAGGGGEGGTTGTTGMSVGFSRVTRIAIINTDPGLGNAEALLSARLSEVGNVTVLERSELRRLAGERALGEAFRGPSAIENMRLGRLLGADALVFMRQWPGEKNTVGEIRVSGVLNGLVAAQCQQILDTGDADKWAVEMARHCVEAEGRIFTLPKEARLVSVAPFTAAGNTPETRAQERMFALGLALRLARAPGVFLLEREEMSRLLAESAGEGEGFLGGNWLLDGAVSPSLNAGEAPSLHLVLTAGGVVSSGGNGDGGDAKKALVISGNGRTETQVVDEAATQLTRIISGEISGVEATRRWEAKEEAKAFFARAEMFFRQRMWEQAQVTAEAAWALGLRDDRVTRLRVEAAVRRMEFSDKYLSGNTDTGLWGKLIDSQGRVAARAAVSTKDPDMRALSLEEFFEQANVMLDLFEGSLERIDSGEVTQFGGQEVSSWLLDGVWKMATVPLQHASALSWKSEYGMELDALQARLMALSERMIGIARERGDWLLLQSLVVFRCKLLPFWTDDESVFQSEVLRWLRESREWPAPGSAHAVWGGVFRVARTSWPARSKPQRLYQVGWVGRAEGRWLRLARLLAASEADGERLFGLALLAPRYDGPGLVLGFQRESLRLFASLVENDHAWPGSVSTECFDSYSTSYERRWRTFTAWYRDAIERIFWTNGAELSAGNKYRIGSWISFDLTNLEPHMLAERRVFFHGKMLRRLALIRERGELSGFFALPNSQSGFSSGEFERMGKEFGELCASQKDLLRRMPAATKALEGVTAYMDSQRIGLENNAVKMRGRERAAELPPVSLTARWFLESPPEKWIHDRYSSNDFYRHDTPRALPPPSDDWILNGLNRVLTRLDREGRIVGRIRMPDAPAAGALRLWRVWPKTFSSLTGVLPGVTADMSEQFFVCPGTEIARVGDISRLIDRLVLFDRRNGLATGKEEKGGGGGEWRELRLPQTVSDVLGIRIFGEKIFFSWLNNPEAAKRTDDDVRALLRGEPVFGVSEYDVATGKFSLIASSRREPALSPADNVAHGYFVILRLSEHEWTTSGQRKFVYDTRDGAWRAASEDEAQRLWRTDSFDGRRWRPAKSQSEQQSWGVSSRRNTLVLSGNRGDRSTPDVVIPLALDDRDVAHHFAGAPDFTRDYEVLKKADRLSPVVMPGGILLQRGPVYYWLPDERIEEACRRVIPAP